MTEPKVQAWDRTPEETETAWHAFVAYRDMDPPRSLAALGQKLGCTKQNVEKWSAANRWVERCRAFDADRDRIRQEESVEELKELARRNVRIAAAAQSKLAARLKALKPDDISPKSIPSWMRAFSEMERAARGAPAYRLEVTGPEGGPVEHSHKFSEAEQQLASILGAVMEQGAAGALAEEPDE